MPQPRTPAPPSAPGAATTQAGATQSAASAPLAGVPQTAQEFRALRERRSMLSDQIQSASGRRNDIAEEMRSLPPAAQTGLQGRLAVLDARILQLESDIAETGRQLAATPAHLLSGGTRAPSQMFGGMETGYVTAISIVFTIFVLAPMALAASRYIWKSASRPPARAPLVDSGRMERMEQSVDAIALEIERVSEGQRFLTKLLSENREVPALGAGHRPAETIASHSAQSVPLDRA